MNVLNGHYSYKRQPKSTCAPFVQTSGLFLERGLDIRRSETGTRFQRFILILYTSWTDGDLICYVEKIQRVCLMLFCCRRWRLVNKLVWFKERYSYKLLVCSLQIFMVPREWIWTFLSVHLAPVWGQNDPLTNTLVPDKVSKNQSLHSLHFKWIPMFHKELGSFQTCTVGSVLIEPCSVSLVCFQSAWKRGSWFAYQVELHFMWERDSDQM